MIEANENMEKMTQGMMQACDEINANCSKSVSAFVEATTAASKGCEEFSRNLGAMIQESLSRALSTGKTMMSTRSLEEFGKLQAEFAKEWFDQWVAGAGRLTEISARTTRQTLEPVAQHANDAVNKAVYKAQGKAA